MQDTHGFDLELLTQLLVLAFGKFAHGLVEFDFLDGGQQLLPALYQALMLSLPQAKGDCGRPHEGVADAKDQAGQQQETEDGNQEFHSSLGVEVF
jgi:hypothetical protein